MQLQAALPKPPAWRAPRGSVARRCLHYPRIEDIFFRGRRLALDSCRRCAKPAALLRQLRGGAPQQLAAAKVISENGPNDLICKLRGGLGYRPEGRKRKATIMA